MAEGIISHAVFTTSGHRVMCSIIHESTS